MKNPLSTIRNVILHILILLIIFAASLFTFSKLINRTTPDAAETMQTSTFPLIYMQLNGTNFNCLHGYAHEMDVSYIRDSITPLTAEKGIDIQIQTFSTTVDSVSYEILSLDGSESLEKTKVVKLEKNDDTIQASLTLQNKMLMNQEYILKLQLTSGGRDIYYYTHVVLADGLHTSDYLNFVSGFYEKCVNKTDLNTIGAAVEPDATTDEEATLAHMDIHDSVDQLTWAGLNPQIYYKPIPRLTEINRNTATLTMDYRIASVNAAGITEVFNVHEYYRVRFTDSRVFLLNFERTTDEVFNPENNILTDKGINLGITGKNISFTSDDRNHFVAFVQENELWSYEINSRKLTQIFSFPQKENMDYRDFYDANDIHILRVDNLGNIWFAVSGYMNRGNHEGENGVAVYYYEEASSMVDERVFISSMENPSQLAEDLHSLAYLNFNGSQFYVLLENKLYSIDLYERTYEILASGINADCHAVSASGRYFAWLKEGALYNSSTLCVRDLEAGTEREIVCGEDERLQPISYMDEDLIYGLAKTADISEAQNLFPMYRLVFEDAEGNQIKEYAPDGFYVTDILKDDNMLTLKRITMQDSVYTEAPEDHIVSTNTQEDVAMGISTATSSRKQTEVILRIGTTISAGAVPQIVRSKIVTYDTSRTLEIPPNRERQNTYDVYADGALLKRCTTANEAIRLADENVGVVVDSRQDYVWVRGDKTSSAEIKLSDVPQAMASGVFDPPALSEATGKTFLNLTGCTLDEVLYFVSHGRPVIGIINGVPVVIVGYDEYNTYQLTPGEAEWHYVGINDSTDQFEQSGNIFISYID